MAVENGPWWPSVHTEVEKVRSGGFTALPEEALGHIFSFFKTSRDYFATATTCRQFRAILPQAKREYPRVPPEVLEHIFSFFNSPKDCFATALTCKQFSSIMPNVRFDYHSLFVNSGNGDRSFIGNLKKVPLRGMSNYYQKKDVTLQEEEKPSDWIYQDDRRYFHDFQGHIAIELNGSVAHATLFIKENDRDLEIGAFRMHRDYSGRYMDPVMDHVVSCKLIEKKIESSMEKVVQIITNQGVFYHFPTSPTDPTLPPARVGNVLRDSCNAQDDSLLTNPGEPNSFNTNPEENLKKRSYNEAGFDVLITNPTRPKKSKLNAVVNNAFPIQDTDLVLLNCRIDGVSIIRLWNSETRQVPQEIPGSILEASPSGKLFFTNPSVFLDEQEERELYKFNEGLNRYELLNLDFFLKNITDHLRDDEVDKKSVEEDFDDDVGFLNDTHFIIQFDSNLRFLYNLQTEEVTRFPSLQISECTSILLSNMLVANHHIVFTVENSPKETALYIQNTFTGMYESFTSRILSSKKKSNIHAFRIINRDETSFVQVCLKYDHTIFGGHDYVEISLGSNFTRGLNEKAATLPVPQSPDIDLNEESSSEEESSTEEEEEEQRAQDNHNRINDFINRLEEALRLQKSALTFPMPDISSSEEEEEEQLPNNMADYANIVPLDPDSEMSPTLAGLREKSW